MLIFGLLMSAALYGAGGGLSRPFLFYADWRERKSPLPREGVCS